MSITDCIELIDFFRNPVFSFSLRRMACCGAHLCLYKLRSSQARRAKVIVVWKKIVVMAAFLALDAGQFLTDMTEI